MKSPPRRRGSLLPILLTAALWLPCASLPAFGQLLQDSALPRAPDADSRDAEEVTSPSGSGPPVAEGNISLNLRDVPIARVLDLFTEQRGLNIVTSDSVQGKVTVKLDNVPWEQALATILRTRGMGFQKNGEIIQVDTLERLNTETVTRVFEVEHLGVNEAKELATGVLTPAGKLHVLSRSGSGDAQGATMLVVTDTEGALARVQALLEKVDVRPATDRLELIGPDASGRFRVNIRNQQFARVFDQLRRQFGINIMLDGPVDGRLDLSLSGVTEDELIDSILGGSPLRYLKDGRTYHVSTALQFKERLTTRLFQLHFVDAEDVKRFLAPHLSPLGKVEVFTRRARQGFTFGTQTTSRRATGAANPSPERSDTVAVTDTPAALENIAALVAALDVRPQQVSIEVRIVEVTLDHGETMGIDWSVTGRFAGATKPTLLPFKTANASSTPSGDTFRFGTISAQDFTAVLQALSHRNRLKILSNPRISTLNNQEASILIGDKFPITVETIDPQTAVRTVSLDHYEQIGVQLQVVPQISGVQSVNLIIHPAVSTVGPLIQNQFPVISTRWSEAATRPSSAACCKSAAPRTIPSSPASASCRWWAVSSTRTPTPR
ncbi:MAG: hypothetical protein HY303_02490 [Candidatus Wallbacteria bacterium]|nr:hypothetical protein [Candidatus Wallbacteria bacterium]